MKSHTMIIIVSALLFLATGCSVGRVGVADHRKVPLPPKGSPIKMILATYGNPLFSEKDEGGCETFYYQRNIFKGGSWGITAEVVSVIEVERTNELTRNLVFYFDENGLLESTEDDLELVDDPPWSVNLFGK